MPCIKKALRLIYHYNFLGKSANLGAILKAFIRAPLYCGAVEPVPKIHDLVLAMLMKKLNVCSIFFFFFFFFFFNFYKFLCTEEENDENFFKILH